MPTEIAISTYSQSSTASYLKRPTMTTTTTTSTTPATATANNDGQSHLSTETKSGSITLIANNGRKQNVNVIVYRTSLEHFAVLYPQKKICRPLGVITLKNTTVEQINDAKSKQQQMHGFVVRQLGYDTPMTLTFLCEPSDLDGWLVAFTSRYSPTLRHQSSLPIVEEEEI